MVVYVVVDAVFVRWEFPKLKIRDPNVGPKNSRILIFIIRTLN